MKNRVAIFLALALLAQSLFPLLGQLARIPALVAHFYAHHDHAHHSQGDELSFFDFLAEHYGARSHHDDTRQGHSNLPFCSTDTSFTVMLFAPPAGFPLSCITIASVFLPKADFGHDPFHSRLFGQGVFRPPLA